MNKNLFSNPLYVDEYIIETLTVPNSFKKYMDFEVRSDGRKKRNQTVVFEDRKFGVIVRNQTKPVAIYENKNPYLGRLIGESEIIIELNERIRIPSYHVVSIVFEPVPNLKLPRSLGKMLLLADGQRFAKDDVPHHQLYPLVNFYDNVVKVKNRENSKLKPAFSHESECFEYIKQNILKTDDAGFDTFLHNLRFLTRLNPKRRGIYVSGFHPAEVRLDHEKLKNIRIESSKM